MTIRARILTIGAFAGTAGAAVVLAAVAALDRIPGSALGLLSAAALGAVAARLAAETTAGRVVAHLIALDHEGGNGHSSLDPPTPLGHAALDEAFDGLRQLLERSSRLQAESEAIERLARAFQASVNGQGEGTRPGRNGRAGGWGLHETLRDFAALLVHNTVKLEEVNERMASGAADQSETVTHTTTTVEALSDKIDRISQHAEDAAEACEKSRQEACRGLEQVHSVIVGMDRLRAQVDANGRKARRLGDRSLEIGTIVELIRGISSRTDMLALNATIESVRAGEHGRGFAVVAEEIRKLAERTAGATREIGTLVEAIQADTHDSIRAMSEEQTQMEQEAQRVREAGTALERISEVAEYSARLVEGISRSSNDQVLATQELVRAMQRITEVSQRAHEGTTQVRALIAQLAHSCAPLHGVVDVEKTVRTSSTAEQPLAAVLAPRLQNRLARSEQPA
jgi:twitching motility protein PilJ